MLRHGQLLTMIAILAAPAAAQEAGEPTSPPAAQEDEASPTPPAAQEDEAQDDEAPTAPPAAAPAQEPRKPPATKEEIRARLEEIKTRLQLTEAQQEQIRPILEEEMLKAKEARDRHAAESGRDRRGLVQELRSIQQDAQRRIGPLLTREQQEEWKKIRAEMRDEIRAEAQARRKRRQETE